MFHVGRVVKIKRKSAINRLVDRISKRIIGFKKNSQEGVCETANGRRQINSSARNIKPQWSVSAVGGRGVGADGRTVEAGKKKEGCQHCGCRLAVACY